MKIIYRILNREGTNSKINLNNINIIQINGLCGEVVGGRGYIKTNERSTREDKLTK